MNPCQSALKITTRLGQYYRFCRLDQQHAGFCMSTNHGWPFYWLPATTPTAPNPST